MKTRISVLSVVAIMMLSAFTFTSCTKDDSMVPSVSGIPGDNPYGDENGPRPPGGFLFPPLKQAPPSTGNGKDCSLPLVSDPHYKDGR